MIPPLFPDSRPRRLRSSQAVRDLIAPPSPGPEKFLWPVFLVEGNGIKQPIASMPGQFRYSIDQLIPDLEPLVSLGIGGVLLFAVLESSRKSTDAAYSAHPESIIPRAIRELKLRFPSLTIFTDVCVCAYTPHGHCGILSPEGKLLNDPSLQLLTKMATVHAQAGADAVAPSAMLDGQIQAIRHALDLDGFSDTILMAYSTKFASSMYGPFRDAADSSPTAGDRKSYQADFRSPRQALLESLLDQAEGADILMVKPALFYLDLIQQIKSQSLLPVAAYNVSGEYSMLHASAQNHWGDLDSMVREATTALFRSGSDLVISYWTNQYSRFWPQ